MKKPAKKKADASPPPRGDLGGDALRPDTVHARPAHRPSSFRPEFVRQAAALCRLGATDMDLADFFEVSHATIDNWKVRYKDFLGALKLGKDESDDIAERSLYNRVKGYTFDTEEVFCKDGVVTRVQTRKHVPPDVVACIFWLKNRRKSTWRDRPDGEPQDGQTVKIEFIGGPAVRVLPSLPGEEDDGKS